MVIPKLLNWQRAQFQLNYNGKNANRGKSTSFGSADRRPERMGNFSGLTVNRCSHDDLRSIERAGAIPQ